MTESIPATSGAPQGEQTGTPAPDQNSGEQTTTQNAPVAEPSAQSRMNAAMAKLRKEHSTAVKELAALKAKQSAPDGEDFKAKYGELNDKFTRLTSELGRAKIENMLAAKGVIKPALAAKLLSDEIKVEDGELVTDTGETPENIVAAFIAENPYLIASRQTTGVGSRAPAMNTPKNPNVGDIQNMSAAEFTEWQKQVGMVTTNKSAFGR